MAVKPEMHEFPPLIPEELMERARKLSPANLCDGMKDIGILNDGCMDYGIGPVSDEMKFWGTACTVETTDGDNFPIHVALYAAKPGYVMVVDGKNDRHRGYFGDNMMTTGKVIGLEAMVVDGCVRDKEGCKELGFPVFSRGYIQRGPTKNLPGVINAPINCGGITVKPGDLVVGDADGISVVPRERLEEVLEKAEAKLVYDNNRKAVCEEYARQKAAGEPTLDLAPAWVHEILGD